MKIIIASICATALITACSGGGGESGQPPVLEKPTAPHQEARPIPASFYVSDSGEFLGIGPAFRFQSPEIDDLPGESRNGEIEVRSGKWRDPQGRDGSNSASEIVRFINAFQSQANREYGAEVDLVVFGFGGQKTLRIGSTASREERYLVRQAVGEINASLPWDKRILLGDDLSSQTSPEEVPDGEIHLHFTSGKSSWPDNYVPPDDDTVETLGIGQAFSDPTNLVFSGGWAVIDSKAVGDRADLKRHVIAHEILHAFGIGAHVDPELFQNSILAPTANNYKNTPRIFLTIDGDALLAESMIEPGTRIAGLTTEDIEPWSDTAFHVLGFADLGDENNGIVQFGAGFRNGLSKPWAYGPIPKTRLLGNRALSGMGSATWNGILLGFSSEGRTVAGDARIGINLDTLDGNADFTKLESWEEESHPGQPGTGRTWGDGDIGYTIEVVHDRIADGFVSTFAPGDDLGVVSGIFVGESHEGAAGIVEHPDLSAAFGATR